MSYGIMRVDKVKTITDCSRVLDEMLRKSRGLSTPEYLQTHFKGSDIDCERTELNYDLSMDDVNHKPIGEVIKGICDEVGCKVRSNSVMGITGLYTCSPEYMSQLDDERKKEYFRDCLQFHKEHYGRVISFSIHEDEKTPHLHVFSIPITDDGRLSAKDLMGNRKQYHERQEQFYREVCEPRNLQHPQTKDRDHNRQHLDNLSFKVRERRKELLDLQHQERELTHEINSLTVSLNLMQSEVKKIEQQHDLSIDDIIRQSTEESQQLSDARKFRRLKSILDKDGIDVEEFLRNQDSRDHRDLEH